jgi:hypothetical protein
MATCSQCGKPAVVTVGGNALCVDCNLKFAQAQEIRDRALKQQANFIIDQMEARTGLYGVTPRYEIDTPVIHQGPMNFHNINVDRSVVGAINTGNVEQMEVTLNDIHANNPSPELENRLKEFTEAVLREASLSIQAKDDIVEQLTALAAEVAKPQESRTKGVVMAVVKSVAASIPAALIEHWDTIRAILSV